MSSRELAKTTSLWLDAVLRHSPILVTMRILVISRDACAIDIYTIIGCTNRLRILRKSFAREALMHNYRSMKCLSSYEYHDRVILIISLQISLYID